MNYYDFLIGFYREWLDELELDYAKIKRIRFMKRRYIAKMILWLRGQILWNEYLKGEENERN